MSDKSDELDAVEMDSGTPDPDEWSAVCLPGA